ncbi:MAG TPA: DUF1552 domain-containing protein [Vicinamibacterales bacterium]|jgi:hypothetical protein|nr:DUF1552 domain-containing protein [Vicinamibacterales bacterium]
MIITKRHVSRRTVLKGLGVSVALPFLDAMTPAATALVNTDATGNLRFVAVEMVHGAAGSSAYGAQHNLWSPAAAGPDFDLTPTALAPLDPLRDYITIVSNTDARMAEAFTTPEIGGDHFRASAVFLTQAHPKQTMGSDLYVGTSFDQIYARRFGQDTAIPSMQLCIEAVDHAGGCEYNYSCAYTDAISWASPSEPLPMLRDPRAVFDALFGAGATPEDRARRRREDRSVLDTIVASIDRLKRQLGAADRARLTDYLDDVREIERRIQNVETANRSGETRELPGAPVGVPDSYEEHVKLMFDLQAVALASNITRVFAFKLSRDVSGRVFPQTGVSTGFHNASHHNERPERILDFAKINKYHISLVPYFLDRLKRTPDGDGNLLDHTLIVYGSPMGNPNVHNHKRCPLFLAGKAGGRIKGGLHVKAADGTPMANVFLTLAHVLGMSDMATFGDSTGELDVNATADLSAAE